MSCCLNKSAIKQAIHNTSLFINKNGYLYLCLFLIGAGFIFFLKLPVVGYDTDLWYHLNGGRYIVENRLLPDKSFFSFIDPARGFIDYYWLFQVLVFKIYSITGYYGLIVMRAMLYTATILVVLLLFAKGEKKGLHSSYAVIIFMLCLLFLQLRFLFIRPHMFSYLMIPIFLYLLECRGKKMFFLPVLAVLWCNIHGIEYPVMLFILCAYMIEFIVATIQERKHSLKDAAMIVTPIVLSVFAIFMTPHGLELLRVPFVSTEFASQYIGELAIIKLPELLTYDVVGGFPSYLTILSIIILISSIMFVFSFFKGSFRISHVLCCIAGFFLLTKGNRFGYEFVLLVLPLISSNRIHGFFAGFSVESRVIRVLTAGICLFMPLMSMVSQTARLPEYPFSKKGLPHGNALFLNRITAGGSVLNEPGKGGYLQWMLYPKYKIFMDSQVPFLFTDRDMFVAINMFHDKGIFKEQITKYRPSFINVSIINNNFNKIISNFDDYVPVFYDDMEVLLVNRTQYPEIATTYELKIINPFELFDRDIDKAISGKDMNALKKELSILLSIYPECQINNHLMAIIYFNEIDYHRTISHADIIIKNFPESPVGYKLKGMALAKLKFYDKAIDNYKKAFGVSLEWKEKKDLYKRMAVLYIELDKYNKAYSSAKRAINVFIPETNYAELYELGSTALLSGRKKEAEQVLRLGYMKVPEDNMEWKKHYKNLFDTLGVKVDKVD